MAGMGLIRPFSLVAITIIGLVYCAPYADDDSYNPGPCNSMLRLSRCRTLMVDYKLVRDDFPALRSLTDEEINKVLSDDLCVISEGQLAGVARKLITKPSLQTADSRAVEGYRRASEGRAIVMYSELMEGWVNVKGTGAINPYQEQHKDGSLRLIQALGEFFKAKMVEKALAHSRGEYLSAEARNKSGKWFPELRAVPYYAVIAYDHYGLFSDSGVLGRDELGLIVRQAHRKAKGYLANHSYISQTESILRPYGWTATFYEHFQPITEHPAYKANYWINTQFSIDNQLVDFSHFSVFPSFSKRSYTVGALFTAGCRTLHGYPRWTEECITRAASPSSELDLHHTLTQPYPELSFYHLFPNETGPNAHKYDYLHRFGIRELVTSFIPDLQLPAKLNDPATLPMMQRVLSVTNNKVDEVFTQYPINPGLVAMAEKTPRKQKIINGSNRFLSILCSSYSMDKIITQTLPSNAVELRPPIEIKRQRDEL